MAFYIFTGKLGGGKTLCSVGRIKEKLEAGCKVATNLDLDLVEMFGRNARKTHVMRVPDKPCIQDMYAIGKGNESYDEDENGLLVLDECGTWFNSRNWNDKGRKEVNDWFLHARKLGWDVILIIQNISILDSQARDALAEHTAFCKRLDKIRIPFIGGLYKMITGYRLHGPRIHIAKCVYGTTPKDLVSDVWTFRGTNLYACYDTKQAFLDDYPHGVHTMLTPWQISGRYAVKHDKDFYMRMTKIYLKRYTAPILITGGIIAGSFFGSLLSPLVAQIASADEEKEVIKKPVPGIEQKLEAPVNQQVENVILENEKNDKTTLAESFAGWRVSGHLKSKNKQVMTVSDPNGNVYTGSQLVMGGYGVAYVDRCQMTIYSNQDTTDNVTLYASACVPRNEQTEALDISNYPMFKAGVF